MNRSQGKDRTNYGRILLLIGGVGPLVVFGLCLVSVHALYRHMVPAGAARSEDPSPPDRDSARALWMGFAIAR